MNEKEGTGEVISQAPSIPKKTSLEIPETRYEQLLRQPAYVKELGARLKILLDSYRDALICIERWDFTITKIGACDLSIPDERRQDVKWIYEKAQSSTECDNPLFTGRWVAKLLTLWFVEAHIHARLTSIARQLRILCLTIPDETDEAIIEKMNSYSEQLDRSLKSLFTWGRLKFLLLGPSKISAFIAFVSPLFLGGIVINLSSLPEALDSITTLSTLEARILALIIAIGLLIFLITILFFLPVNLGFPAKRAVFTGGLTETDLTMRNLKNQTFRTIWFEDQTYNFFLPSVNLYRLEREVFDFFRVRKPIEFPADIWLNRWFSIVWIVCLGATLVYIYVLKYILPTDPNNLFELRCICPGFAVFMWFYAILSTYITYKNYQKRKSFGDV